MTPEMLADTQAAAFLGERPWTAAEFSALLTQHGIILVGDARSFVLGRVTLDEAEILTIVTLPASRRQGLARTCLSAFEAEAASRGAKACFLEVAESNDPARTLYAAMNYVQVGRRPGYYDLGPGPRIAALVLQKSLIAADR
jgi:[ribosomal protein S18]-alanine N-acetyltransferase